MEKNLKVLIGVVAAIVVVLAIIFFASQSQPTETNQTTTEPESVQDISEQDTGMVAIPLTYANALIKYTDRRIQLDAMCQAHPNTVSYKDNTGIMIDNRSPQTRTVKVGSTFTIKPWGFKIIVLPDVYLTAKTLLVDCDGSQNVATIIIQE